MSGSGTLYFIATPIGNLSDITYRAVETLRSVEVLACEDTRRTGRLLKHLGIHVSRLIVANSHNEASASAEIIELLKQGIDVGLVTDAGMPGISDPGERVASAVIESGEKFTVIPGSSAPVSALVVSGLSTGRYVMEGFLPRKGRERSDRLDRIAMEESTSIMLESPKRIGITLDELAKVCGKSRKAVVVRELTKLHEEITRGSLEEFI
jgi:16S rRNA (cytidine1402-2'-O)-methyltransferase